MLSFFEALAKDRLLSGDASRRMVELLERQAFNDEIPALLPAVAEVAHKTGTLPGVLNEAGIVYGPGGGYIISVFSEEADPDDAQRVIAQVSLLAYERYADARLDDASPTQAQCIMRRYHPVSSTPLSTMPPEHLTPF